MSRTSSLLSEQLTDAAYYILLALYKPRHGYLVMQFITKLTEGEITVGPATLYTLLKKLEESDYIEPDVNLPEDSKKKVYSLTQKGHSVLKAEIERRRRMAEHGFAVIKAEGEPFDEQQ